MKFSYQLFYNKIWIKKQILTNRVICIKKLFSVMLSVLALTFLFGLVDNKASAAPAPSLTDLQIIGLGSDGSNGKLESIDFNQTTATAPLSGQYAYIAVYLKGYASNGQQVRIYSGSTDVSNYATNYQSDTYLTDSGGVVWGFIRYYKVPLSQLTA